MKIKDYIHSTLETEKALLFTVIDPCDHPSLEKAIETAKNAYEGGAHAILVGGSTGVHGHMLDEVTKGIKEEVSVPVILFPGNVGTITKYADATYFMSLLNSSNPYWISRVQMLVAPTVKQMGIEPIATAYLVVEPGGTVGWVGEVNLLKRNNPKITIAFALAAEYMGFDFLITDVGSNSKDGPVPLPMIKAVSSSISIPYIVAGGIGSPSIAKDVIRAGADIIQVGTAFEKDNSIENVKAFVNAIKEAKA